VWRAAYRAFGATTPSEDPDGDLASVAFAIRFPGQLADTESSLHYNHFRDYDATLGRYAQADPIGLSGGINLFSYVKNNPIARRDSLGLVPGAGPLKPPVLEGGSYYSVEAHFLFGGGLTNVMCTDECGRQHKFSYWKVCFGGAAGISATGGLVMGMDGKDCRPETYKGYFHEAGGSLGFLTGGIDIGYVGDWGELPEDFSGVNEAGLGFGLGLMFKSSWCYYTPLP
jgi:RHS repeat-associated protein